MFTEPIFPLRVIFDDGEVVIIEEPDELTDHFTALDTRADANRVWIRDDAGRTVHVVISFGEVREFEVVEA